MKRKYTITFLIWWVLFNWPPILMWVPFLKLFCFLPVLFWINIPALWFGLAKAIGQPHYDIQEFGAVPQTPLSWILIVGFWVLLSAAMTVATAYFPRLLFRNRK